MFHNTHVYLAFKLYRSTNNLLIVGAFLPDLAVMKIIKWEGGLHGQAAAEEFRNFIQKNPSYINLYKGINAHKIVDDITHTNYQGGTGYAFQNNKELSQLVGKYYELDKKDAESKAHNYIESAVDYLLLKEQPEIPNQIKEAIKQIDIQAIAILLSSYFKVDQKQFQASLLNFFNLFTKYNFKKEENWILFWEELEKLLSLKNIGNQQRKKLFDKALGVVKGTYKDFLDYCLKANLQ